MHEFFIPTGLDGKRDGNRSGLMEGGDEDGTLSLPSPWSYSSPSISGSPLNVAKIVYPTNLLHSFFFIIISCGALSLFFFRAVSYVP